MPPHPIGSRPARVFCFWLVLWVALVAAAGCSIIPHPQKGGTNQTTLGGTGPSSATLVAPENPKTPTTQTVEKTTTREFSPPTAASQGDSAREQPETSPRRAPAHMESRVAAMPAAGASPTNVNQPGAGAPGALLRETIIERQTTQIGSSWQDTARELGVRLGNMRGVMWIGVLLMVAGPVVGWKLGWMTNGLIAGGVGLLLVILAQVVPGNEAWFGLAGLLLIPLVAYAWYHGHHTATQAAASSPLSPSTTS